MTARPDRPAIQAEILRQVAARQAGRSICPSEVARALLPGAWQPLMGPVRQAAVALAREGQLEVLRKGRPADLDDLRGVIRLRAPLPGDAAPDDGGDGAPAPGNATPD